MSGGAAVQHVSLEESAIVGEREDDMVALDEALHALASIDFRKARVVELRFFGGLSVEETAEVLKISPITVMRDWNTAKAWLYRELSGEKSDGLRSLENRSIAFYGLCWNARRASERILTSGLRP